MLYWNANFQIPNSGTQCATVYVKIEDRQNDEVHLSYSCCNDCESFFNKEVLVIPDEYNDSDEEVYSYLLTLEQFSQYSKL